MSKGDPPGFVWSLFFILTILYLLFALNQWLQFKQASRAVLCCAVLRCAVLRCMVCIKRVHVRDCWHAVCVALQRGVHRTCPPCQPTLHVPTV